MYDDLAGIIYSPNKRNSPRTSKITRVTPHHCSGVISAKNVANMDRFKNPGGVSCQYIIGKDAEVIANCKETDAAVTSSSNTNDNKAVTFEISNSKGAPGWEVSSKCIDRFVDITVDVCMRNGLIRILYVKKPNNITKDKVEEWIKTFNTSPNDTCLITFHKWYANTDCPGPYLEENMMSIAKMINDKLWVAKKKAGIIE